MNQKTVQLCQIIIILFLLYLMFKGHTVEGFTVVEKQDLFDRFIDEHFRVIFPTGGRNSGGPQFYEYLVNTMNLDKDNFILYNQFYCGVSGSPVSPNRMGGNISSHIMLEDLSGQEWFGKYYRCCTPCPCDLMRYAKVEQHTVQLSDGPYQHHVITIDDPCSNEDDIPPQVNAFTCQNGITQNGIRTSSGRLIIGVLYGNNETTEQPVPYDSTTHVIDSDQFCTPRICQDPNELQGGMGDIFVLLSLVGNTSVPPPPPRFNCNQAVEEPMDNIEPLHDTLLNIYGEPLHECRTSGSTDARGSWDTEGYCSEMGGGVHQICFGVNQETHDFSTHTGQSDWSGERTGNNHCMCIGAWALYKEKQRQGLITSTNNELKCESIPEISLTDQYLNNWATWNGDELPNQIVEGVNKLVEQCYEEGNQTQKTKLQTLYTSLINGKPEFSGNILSFDQR